ncbi:MAG TPA: hypothetical protein EYP55_11140, partial [Anaerolineae bacterium]|nr:hypothetical protein [Anaerolineae bacterium]
SCCNCTTPIEMPAPSPFWQLRPCAITALRIVWIACFTAYNVRIPCYFIIINAYKLNVIALNIASRIESPCKPVFICALLSIRVMRQKFPSCHNNRRCSILECISNIKRSIKVKSNIKAKRSKTYLPHDSSFASCQEICQDSFSILAFNVTCSARQRITERSQTNPKRTFRTSNIGTQYALRGGPLGFRTGEREAEEGKFREQVLAELKRTFRPELLNRIDEVIVFHNLTMEHILQIVDLQMRDVSRRLAERGLAVELTDAARRWLAERGYDPQFGARPLRRTIQRAVESPLSKLLLRGEFKPGDTVVIDVGEEGLTFRKKAVVAPIAIEAEVEVMA